MYNESYLAQCELNVVIVYENNKSIFNLIKTKPVIF